MWLLVLDKLVWKKGTIVSIRYLFHVAAAFQCISKSKRAKTSFSMQKHDHLYRSISLMSRWLATTLLGLSRRAAHSWQQLLTIWTLVFLRHEIFSTVFRSWCWRQNGWSVDRDYQQLTKLLVRVHHLKLDWLRLWSRLSWWPLGLQVVTIDWFFSDVNERWLALLHIGLDTVRKRLQLWPIDGSTGCRVSDRTRHAKFTNYSAKWLGLLVTKSLLHQGYCSQ